MSKKPEKKAVVKDPSESPEARRALERMSKFSERKEKFVAAVKKR